jgi:hypothetical protein
LRYNAVKSVDRQLTFWRDMLLPSSEVKIKPGKKPAVALSTDVITQKKALIITTAVRTSDPAS